MHAHMGMTICGSRHLRKSFRRAANAAEGIAVVKRYEWTLVLGHAMMYHT